MPASLCAITGLTIAGSGIVNLVVVSGHQLFRVSGHFLLDFEEICLIRYFGVEQEVHIGADVATIGAGCFSLCRSLLTVKFGSGCQISNLSESAFAGCSSLASICIPSSIQTISKSCFADCTNLSNVTFEIGSRLTNLGESAFAGCSSLESICVPSSIETISRCCFLLLQFPLQLHHSFEGDIRTGLRSFECSGLSV
jgi:hypothetical protein